MQNNETRWESPLLNHMEITLIAYTIWRFEETIFGYIFI